jgi:flagellar motor switch/type III secretory pathway protein FliN
MDALNRAAKPAPSRGTASPPMSGVRPILLAGAEACEVLRRRIQAALDSWAQDWVRGWEQGRAMNVEMCVAGDVAQPLTHEYEALGSDAGHLWFRRSPSDRASFGCAVVGAELMPFSEAADEWVAIAVDSAWSARNRALCSALLGTAPSDSSLIRSDGLPPDLFALGSGAMQLSCAELGLSLIADSAIWRSVLPREHGPAAQLPEPLPLMQAAHRATAKLEAILGSVDVELPKLLDLRPGDVLRLPQRLDQRIAVLCAGKPLARAVLGEALGRKCVRVSAGDPHPEQPHDCQ